MTESPSYEDILEELTAITVEALRIGRDEVKPSSRFFTDLNAESIDILDIRFRIEQRFKFKIEQQDIIRYIGRELTVDQFREKFTVDSMVVYITHRLKAQEGK